MLSFILLSFYYGLQQKNYDPVPQPSQATEDPSLWAFPKELHVHISTAFLSAQGPELIILDLPFVV